MLLEVLAVVALTGLSASEDDSRSLVLPVGRLVASPRPYPAGRVDDVHRPGFSRVWIGRTARSREGDGGSPRSPLDWRSPGPAAYGAAEDDASVAYIRVGHNIVAISPWERQSFSRLEEGRRQWLDEHGYTGGVRTFVSDESIRLVRSEGMREPLASKPARAEPEPRLIIELPEDMPRQKSRLRVDAGPATDAPSSSVVKAVGTAPTPPSGRQPSVVHRPASVPAEPRLADAGSK
jgi:hypothetical protein